MALLGKSEKRGISCKPTQDGKLVCRPYVLRNNQKIATGTEVSISVDEKCNPQFPDGVDMLDEDKDSINEAARQLAKACKADGFN